MQTFILLILSLFSAIGIISAVRYIINELINRHKKNPCIVIGVKNHEDSIEGIVRILMKQHPGSEILIIDYGSTDNTKLIIDKLCKDYVNVNKTLDN